MLLVFLTMFGIQLYQIECVKLLKSKTQIFYQFWEDQNFQLELAVEKFKILKEIKLTQKVLII